MNGLAGPEVKYVNSEKKARSKPWESQRCAPGRNGDCVTQSAMASA
jgi:hypothetical protein